MNQEDKELLLKDLCTRLPYHCRVFYEYVDDLDNKTYGYSLTLNTWCIDEFVANKAVIKPYLRPMDSMTEEEIDILKSKCFHSETEEDWEHVRSDVWGIQILDKYDTRRWDNTIYVSTINMSAIDWLNANHFDYRGLIPKDLAIAVTKENNPYKEIRYETRR